MDLAKLKIQNMILRWIATQASPVSHTKIRDICNSCSYSASRGEDSYTLYKYFYPLVRTGLVEICQSGKISWQLAPPSVFYKDTAEHRSWIGVNLTEAHKNLINADIVEDKPMDNFEQLSAIIRWESEKIDSGSGLPIVMNPCCESLLRYLPKCSINTFAEESPGRSLKEYKQIYSSLRNTWKTMDIMSTQTPGLYRQSEKPFARRVYFDSRTIYSIRDNPDNDFWAKAMHCIDNSCKIATYYPQTKKLQFHIDPPFILGRVLLLNQMFSHFLINSRTYYDVSQKHYKELQRIFGNSIIEGE